MLSIIMKMCERFGKNICGILLFLTFIVQVQRSQGQCRSSWSSHLVCDGSKANITTFPQLNPDPAVSTLSIINTNLPELQWGKVELPRYPNLKTLVLRSNGIFILSNLSLDVNNPSIEQLHLQQNRLSEIPADMLKGITELEYLDLSNNQIFKIEKKSFCRNQFLKYLNLADNRIKVIHQYAFEGLHKLQYLGLRGNVIQEFPFNESNYSFPALIKINLSNNNISKFTPVSGKYESCRTLDLNFNRIDYVGRNFLRTFQNMSSLFLDHNSIFSLHPVVFGEQPHNLSHLFLRHNYLKTFPLYLLRGLPRLYSMSLSNNLLTNIPANAFIHNPYLETIVLDNNLIHSLHSLTLAGLSSLRQLSLTFNELTTLPTELFQPVGYFLLELRGNNLTCDCEIFFLQKWLKKSTYSFDKIECVFHQTGESELVIHAPFEDICVMEHTTIAASETTDVPSAEETDLLSIMIENGPTVGAVVVTSLTAVVILCALCRNSDKRGQNDEGDEVNL